jgi:hypothetical protein
MRIGAFVVQAANLVEVSLVANRWRSRVIADLIIQLFQGIYLPRFATHPLQLHNHVILKLTVLVHIIFLATVVFWFEEGFR